VLWERMWSSAASAGEVWPMHIPGSASQVNECLIQGKCYITDESGTGTVDKPR